MDSHSYGNPDEARVRHIALDLTLDFERRVIAGSATLQVERREPGAAGRLVLDTRDLQIESAEAAGSDGSFAAAAFRLGARDPILGAPLTVELPPGAEQVRLRYQSSPHASGLQWLEPAQTAGGSLPFLFSQAEAIHARSFLPCQDSPAVRVTFEAVLRAPAGMVAVMAAENLSRPEESGVFRFRMTRPVPSYLIALAAGSLAFQETGTRTGIWAEPSVVERAAWEFADMEGMVAATEALFGPYRWERFDALVLPPSFPFGGMENPRLTFITPTVLAGDRSLVSVIAHELAHSWSGNLVTNATWSDFWMNEGFTTYIERRIVEHVYGRERAEMEWVLGRQDLEEALTGAGGDPDITVLHTNLAGRDPDDAMTQIAYEKGALFLLLLEQTFGRESFDRFLTAWFDEHAFTSESTAAFETYLRTRLLNTRPGAHEQLGVDVWLYEPGLPGNVPVVLSAAYTRVEAAARDWLAERVATTDLPLSGWSFFETLHFLRALPAGLPAARLAELDAAFHLTDSGNAEIENQWLLIAIRAGYHQADVALRRFLLRMGRRKFLKPLYTELMKTPTGAVRAAEIYREARPRYHPIAQATLDAIVHPPPFAR